MQSLGTRLKIIRYKGVFLRRIIINKQRRIKLEKALNFRQLGGYPSRDGRTVRWGQLYRSGELFWMSPQDRKIVSTLGISTSIDFRSLEEVNSRPNQFEFSNLIQQHTLPLKPGSLRHYYSEVLSGPDAYSKGMEIMGKSYSDLVLKFGAEFKKMFQIILEQEEGAFHFNCAAGKDRTGIAAMLILEALGVEQRSIIRDYRLTALYCNPEESMEQYLSYFRGSTETIDKKGLLPLFSAHVNFLNSAYVAIEQHYSSIQTYLSDVLGLGQPELKALRGRFLI